MKQYKQGKFIVIEGLDGSGSTTQVYKLGEYLFTKDKAQTYITTREPTSLSRYGREIRRRLRGNLLPGEKVTHDFSYWAHLFVNDRLWHLDKVVTPNIENGVNVISDRHSLSTFAYQSTQGGEMEQLIEMHHGLIRPDITFYLDLDVSASLARISSNRENSAEFFEEREFLERVSGNYKKAIELVGKEYTVVPIDATKSIQEVGEEIQGHVDILFGYRH